MKKISEAYYTWLVRNNRVKWSKVGGRCVRILGRKKSYSEPPCPILYLPETISLDSNDDIAILVPAIEQIRNRIFLKRFAPIDLRPVKRITASGALVLGAELDRLRRKRQMALTPWYEGEWHPDVKKIFFQFKIFNLLKIRRNSSYEQAGNVAFVPLKFGIQADGDMAVEFKGELVSIIGEDFALPPWYVALTEAMTNVAQHAYQGSLKKIDIDQAWWMCGSFDKQERILTVMFYDQGITIPGSLPNSQFWEIIRSYFTGDPTDGDQIHAAFEVGRSRTKEKHRGKGVAQLLDPIKNRKGSLRIISRRGIYSAISDNTDLKTKISNCSCPLEGTYIEWKLHIEPGEGHENKNN